ncbi:MAG TPA: hypothetical protein VMW72_21730 [Sedimentisphaerales bacterium]|nr:hypothetical protein [Sedimentisphaerales bacterium]
MCSLQKFADESIEPLKTTIVRFCIVIVFSIAFGYIEAAVVVYLRAIFHPDGFTFPLTDLGTILQEKPLLLTEIGREAATIVLILTGAWLFGRNRRQRFAYVLTIFAIWDIFYYVWLKVLLDWPASIMDWDILFLIPVPWASAVLYPVLISITLLIFAAVILYRDARGRAIEVTRADWLAFFVAGIIVVVSFCTPGSYVTEPDYKSYFYWPLFAAGFLLAIGMFLKCLLKSK